MKDISRNLTMLCDFYELTMAGGYFRSGIGDRIAYFDLFYRDNPDGGGYAVVAGLEQIVDYIRNLHFTEEDIAFLRGKGCFDEPFLDYLRSFRFTGDMWAVPEGTFVFPGEPLITVRAPAIQAQFIETYLLMIVNHESLIATKAARITRAAKGRAVSEFGSRRAQGADAAILGARAAFIGGCSSTACTLSDEVFGVPAGGTMAHSWVQMFDSELDAFRTYCEIYPHNATLLIDTYNVLDSGLPHAIAAFDEVLRPRGITSCAIRIDSGDITYLTQKIRARLDEAGWQTCKIVVSNSMDEYIIRELIRQGACIDAFGVGERLITAKSDPVFGGVYKLAAVREDDGSYTPKMKLSESAEKMTIPCLKKVWRIYDQDGKAMADLITMADEVVETQHGITLFDPIETWKECTYVNSTARCISTPIYENGKRVYTNPNLADIRKFCKAQVGTLWDEVKRFENPHRYYVDLSRNLWDTRSELLKKLSK